MRKWKTEIVNISRHCSHMRGKNCHWKSIQFVLAVHRVIMCLVWFLGSTLHCSVEDEIKREKIDL